VSLGVRIRISPIYKILVEKYAPQSLYLEATPLVQEFNPQNTIKDQPLYMRYEKSESSNLYFLIHFVSARYERTKYNRLRFGKNIHNLLISWCFICKPIKGCGSLFYLKSVYHQNADWFLLRVLCAFRNW